MHRTKSIAERFWEKVDIRGPDECWPWLAFRTSKGYGNFMLNKRPHPAHRIAWILTNGRSIPKATPNALHRCDNRRCCNPTHIFLGTQADNMADMKAKGRTAYWDKQPGSKLTPWAVFVIRKSSDSSRLLAEQFGVSARLVRMVRSGDRWKPRALQSSP